MRNADYTEFLNHRRKPKIERIGAKGGTEIEKCEHVDTGIYECTKDGFTTVRIAGFGILGRLISRHQVMMQRFFLFAQPSCLLGTITQEYEACHTDENDRQCF
ncbi:hypothetical protein D3C85_1523350 [compost metagenome]